MASYMGYSTKAAYARDLVVAALQQLAQVVKVIFFRHMGANLVFVLIISRVFLVFYLFMVVCFIQAEARRIFKTICIIWM